MQSWNENGGVKESDYLAMSTAEHSNVQVMLAAS